MSDKQPVVVLYDHENNFYHKLVRKIVSGCLELGHKTTVYTGNAAAADRVLSPGAAVRIDAQLDYLVKTNSVKRYDRACEYAQLHNAKLIIPRCVYPEFIRLGVCDLVIGFLGYAECGAHNGRVDDWVQTTVLSIGGPYYEPAYDDVPQVTQLQARKDLGWYTDPPPIALFAGNLHYGKGPDLFQEAIDDPVARRGVVVTDAFAGDYGSWNGPEDWSRLFYYHVNRPSDAEMMKAIIASDIVVLPYRESYKDGTSGVLVQAAQCGKRVVVPDFEPFNTIVKQYGTGTLHSSTAESIATAIDAALVMPDPDWSGYLKNLPDDRQLASYYLVAE